MVQWLLEKCRRTLPFPPDSFTTSEISCCKVLAGWKNTGDVGLLWRCVCEIKTAVKATNGTSPKSPILCLKKEIALTVQPLCAIFRSEISSCEPVTFSQRRCTWQQQIAGSVFQWRKSQRSADVSFSPFFDLISKTNCNSLGNVISASAEIKLVVPRNVFLFVCGPLSFLIQHRIWRNCTYSK